MCDRRLLQACRGNGSVAALMRGGGGTGVLGTRRGRRGARMLTPGHRAGWEMRKKGSTSTWIARLLVLGC
jgi:hypothetical protein